MKYDTMDAWRLVAILVCAAGAVEAQSADLTILVDGPLLEHGGLVEVTAVAYPDASASPQVITLTDRYAQVEFRHPEGVDYNYRFRPVPDAMERTGIDRFVTDVHYVGGRVVDGPDGPMEADWRSIRVLPFAEYADPIISGRASAAWGQTQAFADPPPANEWGARALPWVFDTFGNRRTVGLICENYDMVSVCTPDPEDAPLMEALWWRSIAEGGLERLRHEALDNCYDSRGIFGRPERCEGIPGRGWPTYRPVD